MADVNSSDRGVSTVVGYVLNISIALLLITGVLVATSNFVSEQRHHAIQTEATVVSERVVSDLKTADRLVRSGDTGKVAVRSDFPARIAGRSYTVSLTNRSLTDREDYVILRITVPTADISVKRTVHLDSKVNNTTRTGGSITVVATGNGPLEVQDG